MKTGFKIFLDLCLALGVTVLFGWRLQVRVQPLPNFVAMVFA
ncbi:MAG: hypothetical protein ACREUV_08990 [Burkholderiales bacterium]